MAPGDRGRVEAARERVLADHRETLDATLDAADAVAADLDRPADGGALRRRLRARLDERSLLARYPAVLTTAVTVLGAELAADPVSAPPYVVVASTGPLLRGSTAAGRVVVGIRAFAVRDPDGIGSDTDRRYVRTTGSTGENLEIRTAGGI